MNCLRCVNQESRKNFARLLVLAVLLLAVLPGRAAVYYVSQNNASPAPPYASWNTAATNIQDAINAASTGDTVLVTNGLYAYGGISMDGVITNRVTLNKGLVVQSVNGPSVTTIQGALDPVSTNGPGAVRCAWLTNNATLAGFTLRGGATRGTLGAASGEGGGLYCGGTTNAIISNCILATNFAFGAGGGAYAYKSGTAGTRSMFDQCVFIGNQAFGSAGGAGTGGGAYACNLVDCMVTLNSGQIGGGAAYCNATNCAFTGNYGYGGGAAAYSGNLINCTVTGNTYGSSGSGAAVGSATLVNCIVTGNFSTATIVNTNYSSCTLTYCCSDPLPSGTGNIDVNPQLLGDGIHLAAASPCIGAGTAGVLFGTDIDGQPWNSPPSIGCDEWNPAPIIVAQPVVQFNPSAAGANVSVGAAGQAPFTFYWSLNGTLLQDDGHHAGSGTSNLSINHFGPQDAGGYQVVVSNAFGVAASQTASVNIHAVNAAGSNPVSPYSSWATAATNIQDAINAASAGDIVLATNGVYQYGGAVMAGNLTNRIALNKPLIVTSVNGWTATVIQGVRDPLGTNGPAAVRCAYVGDGALLTGFTLQNGATRATGDAGGDGPLESGGGAFCTSVNATIANCVFTNNAAVWGGGTCSGTVKNSLLVQNVATVNGGGAYSSTLYNCTVVNNVAVNGNSTPSFTDEYGGGVCYAAAYNCIVINNYDYPFSVSDNYYKLIPGIYNYTCTSPSVSGTGNITANPQILDTFHIAAASPCRGKGSATYAGGFDLDGEAFTNPPSMGCDEVISADLAGPLSPNIYAYGTNVAVNHFADFVGTYTGNASAASWSFGDGQTLTNAGPGISHEWTGTGTYTLTYTVYNNDNPNGVSTSVPVQVQPLLPVQLQLVGAPSGGFEFQFAGQVNAFYLVQYATNLTPPVAWTSLKTAGDGTNGIAMVIDTNAPVSTRFYRVMAQ